MGDFIVWVLKANEDKQFCVVWFGKYVLSLAPIGKKSDSFDH